MRKLDLWGWLTQNEAPYDSTKTTQKHIRRVRQLLGVMMRELARRGRVHDLSKLGVHEKPHFDIHQPLLKKHEYGTPEYLASVEALKPALDHHYKNNSHHPEHYSDGVSGMSLFDMLEMLADWKAASEMGKKWEYAEVSRLWGRAF